jgi:ferredoxin-NADP reductase
MQGTWSLELKHPQLSISRRYTPLPPPWIPSRTSTLAAESTAALQPGDIKLLVRKYDTGEVSRYLHSLKPGSTIECRGPYSELEIPPEASKVLFLAGGTGVAAGLQVAGALARRGISEQGQAKEMMMLWANRRREEVVGLGDEAGRAEMNEMVTMVEDLERKAETVADVKVRTKYFVDEENRFIQRKDLEEALRSFSSEQGKVRVTAGAGQDEQRQKHDKLVLVTGPDGFVEYFAGPKRVRNGVEVTGMTGGLLSQMKLDGWTVVRL